MKKKNILLATFLVASGSVFGQKLSPNTMLKLNEWSAASKLKSAENATKTVGAFVTLSDKAAIEKMEKLGAKITNVISDEQVIATIPYSALEAVAGLDGIVSINAGSEARLLLDLARKSTNVDDCHSETSSLGSYTGKGVVVGIVDNGFEYCHPAWNDADGNTRVKRIWDQSARSGNAPAKYGYGTEYTTYDEMKAARYDITSTFHGSHVGNIAAGGKNSEKYYGVAPDADIVLVSFGDTNENIVNGINYCFDYAESVGKPCVVNISLGSHTGPHDGTSDTDRAFQSLVGPGRIIVGAGGNEGSEALHASKTFTADDTELKTLFGFDSSMSTKTAYVDIWGDKNSPISVKVIVIDALKGKVMSESPEVSTNGTATVTHVFPSSSGIVGQTQLALQKDPTNGRTDVMLTFRGSSIGENRKVGVVVTGEEGATVHMWNNASSGYFTSGDRAGYTDGDTDYTVGELGGVSKDVITVGSYNTRLSYTALDGNTYGYDSSATGSINNLSLFSSHGPTVDGRTKPDVTAPGCVLISATSKFYSSFQSTYCAERSNGGYYDANAGTSMASPFVAGTVALWLQANPSLTPEEVREILNQSSKHDFYTGTAASSNRNKWGAGKLDAYAGLQLAIQTTGISDAAEENSMFSITTDRSAHTAQFFFGAAGTARVAVYNTLGQQVYAKQLSASGETVDLSSLGSGVFVFKLQQGDNVKSVKAAM